MKILSILPTGSGTIQDMPCGGSPEEQAERDHLIKVVAFTLKATQHA